MVQILGWFRAEAERASCRKRSSPPAAWLSSGGRNLMATCRPSRVSSASYTTPIPPLPSLDTIEYCPMVRPITEKRSSLHAGLYHAPNQFPRLARLNDIRQVDVCPVNPYR